MSTTIDKQLSATRRSLFTVLTYSPLNLNKYLTIHFSLNENPVHKKLMFIQI